VQGIIVRSETSASPENDSAPRSDTGRGGLVKSFRALRDRFLNVFVVSSSSGGSFAYLDGVRAIAVILVVVFHVWALSGTPRFHVTAPLAHTEHDVTIFFATGFVGVELFFVLSGFLLSQPWFRADAQDGPRPRIGLYLRRRLLRIVPAYYAFLFLTIVLLSPTFVPSSQILSRAGRVSLGADLLFLQYVIPSAAMQMPAIHGHLWTLTMEMIFYLVLPWTVLAFLRRRWMIALPVSAFLSVGWLYLSKHSFGPLVDYLITRRGFDEAGARYFLSQQFPAHWVSFALGIVLANLALLHRAGPPAHRVLRLFASPWAGRAYFLIGTGIVMWGMNRLGLGDTAYRHYWWGLTVSLGFTLVIGGIIVGGPWLRAAFGFLPLRLIGIVGFSAYLWHMPLIAIFNKYPNVLGRSPEAHFFFTLGAVSVSLLLISCFMYLAIEKPFLLISRRLDAARRAHAPVPAAAPTVAVPVPEKVGNG
jgi:peptidoglycan/LPS O-acetylase OafA/YrhL